jgi:pyruvate carboxylase
MPMFDFDKLRAELKEKHPYSTERDAMSAALYPQVTDDYLTFRENFGPVDKLDTRIFLTGPKVGEEFEVSSI